MRNVLYAGILYLAIIVQTTLFPRLQIFGSIQPDLVCAVLLCLCVMSGPVPSLFMGLGAGLVLDMLFIRPGLYMVQYAMMALTIHLMSRLVRFDRLLLPSLACFCTYVAKELLNMGYLFFQRVHFDVEPAMGKVLLGGLFTVLLMLPLYQIVYSLHREKSAGLFAQRGEER